MLNDKDKEFIAKLDISKFDSTWSKFWGMYAKIRVHVMENYSKELQMKMMDEMVYAAQVRFGKENKTAQ
jgi:hypothetical protein